jgi:Guanine nucleotide exchange factor in Golgi transport N-terminal/Dimerisation and cyclophilin-binding domain of Mon2
MGLLLVYLFGCRPNKNAKFCRRKIVFAVSLSPPLHFSSFFVSKPKNKIYAYLQECQAPLQEAVLALKAFQSEEWPRKQQPAAGAAAAAVAVEAEEAVELQDGLETVHTHETEDTDAVVVPAASEDAAMEAEDTELTAVTASMGSSIGDANEKDGSATATTTSEGGDATTALSSTEKISVPPPAVAAGREQSTPIETMASSSSSEATSPFHGVGAIPSESHHGTTNLFVDDDPQTREPVHEAIEKTILAIQTVLIHTKQPKPCEIALEVVTLIVKRRYLSGRAGGEQDKKSQSDEQRPLSLLYQTLDCVAKCSESNHESVQNALIACLTAIMTSPKCSVHENSMLTAMRSTFHVYLVTKSTHCKALAKRSLLDMLRAVFFRMEAHDAVLISTNTLRAGHAAAAATNSKTENAAPAAFASQYHADAYYLFRSLCKLSSKELPADNVDETTAGSKTRLMFNTLIPTDPTELHSKILSLELILAGVEYTGEAFTSTKFLYLMQHYLCGSLLKNCVSNHTQVAFLSQKIFLVLVRCRCVGG